MKKKTPMIYKIKSENQTSKKIVLKEEVFNISNIQVTETFVPVFVYPPAAGVCTSVPVSLCWRRILAFEQGPGTCPIPPAGSWGRSPLWRGEGCQGVVENLPHPVREAAEGWRKLPPAKNRKRNSQIFIIKDL